MLRSLRGSLQLPTPVTSGPVSRNDNSSKYNNCKHNCSTNDNNNRNNNSNNSSNTLIRVIFRSYSSKRNRSDNM